jgi:hypothetical protein
MTRREHKEADAVLQAAGRGQATCATRTLPACKIVGPDNKE